MASVERYPEAVLRERGEGILRARGADPAAARTVLDVLLDADRRGVATHGLTRLASYVERIELSQLDPAARTRLVEDAGALALLDAGRGFGAVAGMAAVDAARERAAAHGLAWVTVRESNHFGMAGYYPRQLARDGLAGIVFTNAGPSVAPWGGQRPVVGTNPIAIAVPADPEPVVMDMAVTQVARGKIRRAAAENRPIPEGWALDADGHPTTDPHAAMRGLLSPMGGPKGYALAVMIDLLTGVLSGGAFADEVRGATDFDRPARVSFTLLAADIARLMPLEEYRARVEAFRAVVKAAGDGSPEVGLPGHPEEAHVRRAEAKGIPVAADVIQTLERLAGA
jgi:LDH2 family malate/lactate/ureidoglycolate dehydrogenase